MSIFFPLVEGRKIRIPLQVYKLNKASLRLWSIHHSTKEIIGIVNELFWHLAGAMRLNSLQKRRNIGGLQQAPSHPISFIALWPCQYKKKGYPRAQLSPLKNNSVQYPFLIIPLDLTSRASLGWKWLCWHL